MRLALPCLLLACAAARPPADLNGVARADYAVARGRALAATGPVLLVGPSRITLLDRGERLEFELAPPAYHELKTVSHLALGLHSLFFRQAPPRDKLLELRAAATRMTLPEPRARQERI